MAIQSNRALIACSVLALASAIVTLYYWQLRKRRKQTAPAPVSGERIVAVEEEEGDSQILKSVSLSTVAAVTTNTTSAVVEQIKVLDNCKSLGEEDTVDGATCVEKSNCITIASTAAVADYSCPSKGETEATCTSTTEMANEVEVHDDCRTDSVCADSNPLGVDSVLERGCRTETGAPELTKELSTDGNDSKTTDTVATAADSGSVAVVVENRTPATSAAAVADAGAAASAVTTASEDVVTPTEAPATLQVDNQQEQKEQQKQAAKSGQTQVPTSPPASKAAEPTSDTAAISADSAAEAVVSAGASTSTSTASVTATSDSTTTVRAAPTVTSRKIITSNPVTSSQTFAQVLSKKNAAAVPTTKQSKKMAQSSGPKPVDQPKAAAKAAASNTKTAISYASVVQESSSSSSNSSPASSPRTTTANNTKTTISNSSKEEVDAYRNYPDATSATPSQSSSSVEGQCSPNSDLGEFTCDVRSLGSNDSGTGSSELLHADTTITNGGDHSQQSSPASPYHIVNNNNSPTTATANNPSEDQSCIMCYQFELPFYLCGKLIGSNGHFITSVKQHSGTQIIVGAHYVSSHKICSITGTKAGINTALNMIRKRFPYKEYPEVTFAPLPNPNFQILPGSCQLQLAPDHVVNDVILACTISAGHFFLQQPTHPTYPQLNQLDHLMKIHYSEGSAPQLPDVYPGLLCAAPTEEGWYRAMVKFVNQSKTQCDIMFVDYGGYAFNVPVTTLRPIRSDFIVLPFQASECFLANVVPVDAKNGWSEEANQFFADQAKGQIIHAAIDGYDESGIPFVSLFKFSQGSIRTDINAELVAKGYAHWMTESDASKLNGKN